MASIGDHIRGRNVKLSFRQNNAPVVFRTDVIDVEEVGEEGWDQVNGEQRGRPFLVTDGFKLRISAYVHNLDALRSFLSDTANDDVAVAPLKQQAALRLDLLDGTGGAFILQGCKRGLWKLSIGGRKSAVKQEVPLYCQTIKEAKAV